MTKDAVLALLRSGDGYVSGERLSARLGVSRAAVHAAVKALRAEGYDIRSATNRGYLLQGVPDRLTAAELSAWLPAQRMERVLCLDSVDSTNTRLRAMALAGAPEGQVVLANAQTGGRGRSGRDFASPADLGIYLSILLRPDCLPAQITEITAWTAVAVNDALASVCSLRAGIKWVNDLLLDGRKLCGILTEMSAEPESGYVQHVVIGVGLNVNERPADFPAPLRTLAGSLAMATGRSWHRAQLAAALIAALDRLRADRPREKAR
jgi:BirA family biotin operon repressor/biotin-[acetyl-CoA-carboxylase] ligase